MAAVLEREGRVLVNRRPDGKPMAGSLEFPGGKVHDAETRLEALRRELAEELGIELGAARPLIRYRHTYPDLEVDLDVWRVLEWRGEPEGREGQALMWLHPGELLHAGLLPADLAVVRSLALPAICAVSPPGAEDEGAFLDALEDTAAGGQAGMIVLRRPDLDAGSLLALAAGAACRVEGTGVRLLLHGDPTVLAPLVAEPPAELAPRLGSSLAGVHVPGRYLPGLTDRPVPEEFLFGASCHDRASLETALAAGADYAFLGSVRETPSHPGEPGVGWACFAEWVESLPLPVYAIGGMTPADMEDAWKAGAQGVAAIRGAWKGRT